MSDGWEQDKKKSDVYLNEIKQILGLHLIGEPPVEEDQARNTDLIVLKMDAVRVACRVRNHSYCARYGGEFTIRASRPSGMKTELRKVIEGWGDYMFYGFGDGLVLTQWHLLDLNVFRSVFCNMLYRGTAPVQKENTDRSSTFIPFSITDFPSEFVISKKLLDVVEQAA